ncbi:unnamed protein product [Paramecium octaurelia]|uniref:Endonuclease/exonuclease/phosphatase domain-containing protein n=1 Tax=Paramecium octaurelia TaxID=43137 RepID=A0A8S1TMP7_PAROT|nr:unnamed protein product [Paramecium octaurelia]
MNIYFHNSREFTQYKHEFPEIVGSILSRLGNYVKLVICGDFNTPILQNSRLRDLLFKQITFRRQLSNKYISSYTD